DINKIIEGMEGSSDKYYCDDEDKLSHTIVTSLGELGYKASEQTKQNGSVDITVSPSNGKYKWIAEAKIGYGNTKIFEGILQLVSRYVKRDKHAGLIIYFQKEKSATCFDNWLKFLYKHEWTDYSEKQGNIEQVRDMLGHLDDKTYIKSTTCYADVIIQKPSDEPITVRNFYADLHHRPVDKSGITNKSIKKGQAKNNIRGYCQNWADGKFTTTDLENLFLDIKTYLGKSFDPDDDKY
ncbi:TPA: hypothetical protein U5E23_004191, partial [Yersinia enterocolitica]|nr:hypothetical protein [Yersinia enterocolitica]